MGCNNKTLISNNVREIKNSDKKIRHLNTLKTKSILTIDEFSKMIKEC